jgi:hypothetical protein
MIARSDLPAWAAWVAKPARRECPENREGSSPDSPGDRPAGKQLGPDRTELGHLSEDRAPGERCSPSPGLDGPNGARGPVGTVPGQASQ